MWYLWQVSLPGAERYVLQPIRIGIIRFTLLKAAERRAKRKRMPPQRKTTEQPLAKLNATAVQPIK